MAPDLRACVRELVPFSWSESKQLDVATDVPFPIAVEGDRCFFLDPSGNLLYSEKE